VTADDPDAVADDRPSALSIVGRPRNLRRTATIALVVGTILFSINQLDVVLSGDATTSTWIKVAATYVVPFVVANLGVIHATHTGHEVR
jgi:hypothetical protein